MEDIRPFPAASSFSTVFFAFFRAALGLLLLVRGINFIFNMSHLQELIQSSSFSFNSEVLAYIISIAHVAGGTLIVVGLITRVALLVQIPIVIAAIIFNIQNQSFGSSSQLILALVVLVLLIFYLVKGPGTLSMDHYRRHSQI